MATALVTAGSAFTMLDDVRSVQLNRVCGNEDQRVPNQLAHYHHEMQNIFRGALGIRIAVELASRGIDCTLLIRKDSLSAVPNNANLRLRSFKTFEDLELELMDALSEKPDYVFMSAAPPDYAPVKLDGKMRSDQEEIQITYRRTPKLIDRIKPLLPENAFLVGFKLLVNVTWSELEAEGKKQIARTKSDLCVTNDLAKIDQSTGLHPMQLVFPDGRVALLEGKKSEVASRLVDTVLSRRT